MIWLPVAAVAAVVLVVLIGGVWAEKKTPPSPACVDPEMREKIREVMIHGLDDALRRHTIRIFNTWMKDPSEQPHRARAGMKHGIEAYIGSYKAAHEWNPPPC